MVNKKFSFVIAAALAVLICGFSLGQAVGQENSNDSRKAAGKSAGKAASIFAQAKEAKGEVKAQDVLVSLGINSNPRLIESSGVSVCSFVENTIWTHNDSGHSSHLFLLKTDGVLLAKVKVNNARNVDWESMSRFKLGGKSYLMVGDVGDNLARRRNCQLYLIEEPDLSSKLPEKPGKEPIETSANPIRLDFTYPDGARNCEAIAVDVVGKQIWLVEKIYLDKRGEDPPGMYVLPLATNSFEKPIVAKRVADFPPCNVTGMDFSPNGRRLIIRNYLTAHLYSRVDDETWEDVIKRTNPNVVVLPLQRQGESVCFTDDSKSIIVTSELNRQPIWRVNLKSDLEKPRRIKKQKSGKK